MTAAIIKTEKIHNILWWKWEGVEGIPRPEGGIPGHHVSTVLFNSVQMKHCISRVAGILKNVIRIMDKQSSALRKGYITGHYCTVSLVWTITHL